MTTNDLTISYIVATRERREALKTCLESIYAQDYEPKEVVVVDDASTDGTAAMLQADFPSARVIRLGSPGGEAAARNLGISEAVGDVVVLLDDDAYLVGRGAAAAVAEAFAGDTKLAALCFKVEAPDGSIRHKEVPRADKVLPSDKTEIGYFLEGAVALRMTALADVGLFPADYGYGGIGLDLAYRLFRAGYRMVFTPAVTVVHLSLQGPDNTVGRQYHYLRNRIWTAARNLPFPYAQTTVAVWTAGSLVESVRAGRPLETPGGFVAGVRRWRELRRSGPRLTRPMMRRLQQLSGRTWY